jgi:hypothetical protein
MSAGSLLAALGCTNNSSKEIARRAKQEEYLKRIMGLVDHAQAWASVQRAGCVTGTTKCNIGGAITDGIGMMLELVTCYMPDEHQATPAADTPTEPEPRETPMLSTVLGLMAQLDEAQLDEAQLVAQMDAAPPSSAPPSSALSGAPRRSRTPRLP